MRTNWDKVVAIHDTSTFGQIGLDIPGVDRYSDRALLLPADAVVVHHDGASLEEYLGWLKSPEVRLGPKSVIRVRGRTLFEGLEADRGAMEKVQDHVRRHGCRIQVFNRTDESEAFFARHGFGEGHVHSAPQDIAQRLANKAELRRMAAGIGQQHAFPEHVTTKDPRRVMATVKSMLGRPSAEVPCVYVKRSDLAGGYGMIRIARGEDVEAAVIAFLRAFQKNEVIVEARNQTAKEPLAVTTVGDPDHLKRRLDELLAADDRIESFILRRTVLVSGIGRRRINRGEPLDVACADFIRSYCENEIIVEVGYPHEAYSTQYVLGMREGGEPFLGVTRQLMDGTNHVGNALTRFRHPDRLSQEAYVTMKSMSESFARFARQEQGSYVGTIGFDFIRVTDGPEQGRIFLLECNPRQTAATYPLAVSSQLRDRYPEMTGIRHDDRVNWGVVMLNGVPTKAASFGELKSRLGKDLLFEGTFGIIPFNIRLMELPAPRCGIIAVAETIDRSETLLEEARRRLAA